ncbi:MAG TPA: fumarylacetoacetate hydrolase family protein [Polyangiaceae bacterium]|jgi:2-keto-4-pentenoate hydratase/2-oxohepta-3-ene-1,7-dioic acid hydratase in catechol pathway
MRLYTFEMENQQRIGAELDGRIIDLNAAYVASTGDRSAAVAKSMIDLIRSHERALVVAREALAFAARQAGSPDASRWSYAVDSVRLCAPIPRPGKILCSGLNYRSHLEENPDAKLPEEPRFFAKMPSVVIGASEPIHHPGARFEVDYEVELAVVIGKSMFRETPQNTMSHVFGYTVFHDVSARFIQFRNNNEIMGKNFDTFAPMGPCIVTVDEIPDPIPLRLTLKLNGQTMQDRTNHDWCFPLPRMLAWLSMAMTLEPGDVMTTGTPAGVGCFRRPPVYLKPGDVCELEISGIGKLVNPVISDEYRG